MKFQQPKKWNTPSQEPIYVHYWDKIYQKTDIWFHWIAFKGAAESFLPEIMEDFACNLKEAKEILWESYIDATCGDEESPLWDASGDLLRALSEKDFTFFMIHLAIGTNIYEGNNLEEATQIYVDWLNEDQKENGRYGKYRVTTDLEIIPVPKKKRARKSKK